jgi:hypothetical protein
VTDHFALHCANVDAGKGLFHGRLEQRDVRDFAKVFGNKPNVFFRSHPVAAIEASEIHGTGVAAERAFSAQVEVDVKIAHGQLSEAAVDGFAIAAASEVGFGHRAPMSANAEDGDHVVGIAIGFEVKDQWRKADHAQSGSGKGGALQAMSGPLPQYHARRPRRYGQVIRHVVNESLDAGRRLERAQRMQFRWSECKAPGILV